MLCLHLGYNYLSNDLKWSLSVCWDKFCCPCWPYDSELSVHVNLLWERETKTSLVLDKGPGFSSISDTNNASRSLVPARTKSCQTTHFLFFNVDIIWEWTPRKMFCFIHPTKRARSSAKNREWWKFYSGIGSIPKVYPSSIAQMDRSPWSRLRLIQKRTETGSRPENQKKRFLHSHQCNRYQFLEILGCVDSIEHSTRGPWNNVDNIWLANASYIGRANIFWNFGISDFIVNKTLTARPFG